MVFSQAVSREFARQAPRPTVTRTSSRIRMRNLRNMGKGAKLIDLATNADHGVDLVPLPVGGPPAVDAGGDDTELPFDRLAAHGDALLVVVTDDQGVRGGRDDLGRIAVGGLAVAQFLQTVEENVVALASRVETKAKLELARRAGDFVASVLGPYPGQLCRIERKAGLAERRPGRRTGEQQRCGQHSGEQFAHDGYPAGLEGRR